MFFIWFQPHVWHDLKHETCHFWRFWATNHFLRRCVVHISVFLELNQFFGVSLWSSCLRFTVPFLCVQLLCVVLLLPSPPVSPLLFIILFISLFPLFVCPSCGFDSGKLSLVQTIFIRPVSSFMFKYFQVFRVGCTVCHFLLLATQLFFSGLASPASIWVSKLSVVTKCYFIHLIWTKLSSWLFTFTCALKTEHADVVWVQIRASAVEYCSLMILCFYLPALQSHGWKNLPQHVYAWWCFPTFQNAEHHLD